MRLHRFYINEKIESGEVEVRDKEILHQWLKVFRLKRGNKVILFDGSGTDFVCEIKEIAKNNALLSVAETTDSPAKSPALRVFLFQSVIKKDKFEWVAEKCTEIGVADFTAVLSERSEKKGLNDDRVKKIIKEASEQSGRGTVPEFHGVKNLRDLFKEKFEMPSFALDMGGEKLQKSKIPHFGEVALFVGPEGGWSEKEISFFKERKIAVVSLGSQTLRAETAAVAAAALLLL
ncbi:MAG: RsmE family RNA methyltransferase [bacterium]|nr:RsmE family RNA methyltransferase [bacterium]